MRATFDVRIARAQELANLYPAACELLRLYTELARFQKTVFERIESGGETDVRTLARYFPDLLELIGRLGPTPLIDFGAAQLQTGVDQEALLVACWEGLPQADPIQHEAGRFYARVLLQPYAEYLATRGDVAREAAQSTCPFCNARPIAGVLRGEGDGAKRWLLCSLCATEWQYRRVLCPNCGEENKDRLPIYIAAEFDYIRVDACDTCRTYIKSIDLTRNGRAVPVVDELATIPLDLWAEEHGYTKLESNLLGI